MMLPRQHKSHKSTLHGRPRQKILAQISWIKSSFLGRCSQEILSKIFLFSLPDLMQLVNQENRTPFDISSPLILSAVCRRWRNVAFASPELWTDVPIVVRARTHQALPILLKEWIERSNMQQISIYFTITPAQDCRSYHFHVFDTIKVLMEYSSIWRTFIYNGPDSLLSSFKGTRNGIMCIQTLVLHPTLGVKSLFDLRPLSLRPYELVDLLWISPRLCHNMDWRYLSRLRLTRITIHDCLHVLSNAPQLTECYLVAHQLGEVSQPDGLIVHLCLERLTLVDVDPLAEFLGRLRCLNLRSLSLQSCHIKPSTYGSIPTLTNFIEGSTCALESLSLKETLFHPDEIESLFVNLEYLQRLHIEELVSGHAISEDVVHSITEEDTTSKQLLHLLLIRRDCPTNGPLYLPALRCLTLYTAHNSDLDTNADSDFLLDWWPSRSRKLHTLRPALKVNVFEQQQ